MLNTVFIVLKGKPSDSQQHVAAMAAMSGSDEAPRSYVWGNFQDVLFFFLRFFRTGSAESDVRSEVKKPKQSTQMVVYWNIYHWGCRDLFQHFNYERSCWAKLLEGCFRPMIRPVPEGLLWDSQRPRARSALAMVERDRWLARHIEMSLGGQVANLSLGRIMPCFQHRISKKVIKCH